MEKFYNTICVTDKGLENITIDEIKNILNKDVEYKKLEKNNKVYIFLNLDFEERLKLLYLSRTIDKIYKIEGNKEIFLLKNLYDRKYEIKKIKKLKSTFVLKILIFSNIKEDENILNLQDDGSFSIEEGLLLKNIPPMFFRKREILEYSSLLEKFENIKDKIKGKIYCVNQDKDLLYSIEKNAEKALVSNIIYFRGINIEWIDLKFKEEFIDKIFTFRIKKDEELNKKDKYIFFHSNKLLKKNGKLFLLLYNKKENYEKILLDIESYIKKYNLRIIENIILYHGNKKLLLVVIQKV
ncbi:MAG: hypothetical protein ACP5GJ_01700 [Nanopusillaceae archaeon]|jgi:23S rRNA G2445 N2-methylase RlmL